jgi:hypothetical protein
MFIFIYLLSPQITYTNGEGAKCLRVVCASRPVTHSREGAETAINSAIVGLAAVHRSAALAQKVPHAHPQASRSDCRMKLMYSRCCLLVSMPRCSSRMLEIRFTRASK